MTIDRTPRWLAWLFLAFMLCPLWLSSWLPTTDFTNHVARCWILSKLPGDPFWTHYYRVNNLIASNMATDLLLPFLFKVFSAETAGRLLMSLIVVLHWAGIRLLARQAGTAGWLTLVPLFFVYNSIYYMGFANYCLSVTLVIFVVAIWFSQIVRSWNGTAALALFLLGTITYLSHLGGIFCLGMSAAFLGAWDLVTRQFDRWKVLYYSIPFVPVAILYVGWPPQAPDPVPIQWDGIISKLLKSLSFFTGYDYRMDAVVVLLFAAGVLLAWRAGLQWNPKLFGLGLLFCFLYITFPYSLASGSDAYTRFIIPAGVFVGTAVRIRSGKGWQGAVVLLLGAMVLKMSLLTGNWIALGNQARVQLNLLDRVEPHSIVLPMVYLPQAIAQEKRTRFLGSLPTAAVYRREALVLTTFAVKGQHSISLRQPFGLRPGVDDTLGWGRIPPEYNDHPELIDFQSIFSNVNYVYTWSLPEPLQRRILQYGTLVGEADQGMLYRRR